MNFPEVKELFTLFDQSSVRECSIKIDNVELYLNKNQTSANACEGIQENRTEKVSEMIIPVAEEPVSQPTNVIARENVDSTAGKIITAPIVGVVYLSPAPDEPVFKAMGVSVATGETLCIIEAMKLMNEIKSEATGQVAEIYVENEQVVEYGQPLFRLV